MTDLTPDLLQRAGMALYGDAWQSPLARLLGVNDRTIRRIAQAAREGTAYDVNPAWAGEVKAALTGVPLQRERQARLATEVLEALAGVEARSPDDPRERRRSSQASRD